MTSPVGSRSLGLSLVLLVAMAAPARAVGTTPDFVGDFTDFNSMPWRAHWSIVSDDIKCKALLSTAPCNWGYPNLKTVDEAGVPGGGQALNVTYPAPSGPPSCGCGIGGAQLYQDLKGAPELTALAKSQTIDLKYFYKFPVGFDFGGNTAGKMPGLYGGDPGCESGGARCPGAWSTRYMWRGGSASTPNGEVYFYTASGSGYGADLGVGSWKFIADGQWHSIEQLVDLTTGKVTIWHDGKQAFQTTQKFPGPTSGIFFSTFHGGHDTSWSPRKTTAAQFAHFTLSTEGPQTDSGGPVTTDGGAGAGSDAAVSPPADAPIVGEDGPTGGEDAADGTSVGGGQEEGSGTAGSGGSSTGGGGAGGTGSAGRVGSTGAGAGLTGHAASNGGCTVGGPEAQAPYLCLALALIALARRRRR